MKTRTLVVMRHATAGSGGVRDHDRRLTAHGLDEAHRVGVALASAGPIPDRVLCSTAMRCRETWDAMRAGLGRDSPTDFEEELYNASAEGMLSVLSDVVDARSVLLLAHNPGVSMLSLELARADTAAEESMRGGFTPASIACFEVEGDWSSLSASSTRWIRFERGPSA